MFRYLTVLLFLLILFPLLKKGDASSVSAQSFTYEDGSYWLPDIEIKGNEKKVICNCCGESFYDEDALDVHIRHNSVCADYYGILYEQEDGDNDADKPKDGKCYGCGKSIEECTCKGVDCPGNNVKDPPNNSQPPLQNESQSSNSIERKPSKSNVSMSNLIKNFLSSVYNRVYNPLTCGHCLRGWKTIWKKSGLGEYANTVHAKDFGNKLLQYGFKAVYNGYGDNKPVGYIPQVGDTRIWDTYPGQPSPSGHIDWWNGTNWVSDYKQQSKWVPGKNYKKYNVSYIIYR